MSKQYVCVDVETTGLNPDVEEIVEVCARRFKEDGSLGKEFYQRCRPISGRIPEEASNIHKITYDMVKDCPTYLEDGVRESLAEFIGDRKVIGHNLIDFDIKFLKIKPKEVEDTLVLCRERFSGGNNLKKACLRAGIKFDPKKAHGASYDVEKCIELYLHLKNMKATPLQTDVFNQPPPTPPKRINIEDIFTQPYSFSRINLFHQCPYKWKKRYIEKIYDPEQSHLITGKVCHKIAERTSVWCYRETFANKFVVFAKKVKFPVSEELYKTVAGFYSAKTEVTEKMIGTYLFEVPSEIVKWTESKGMSNFLMNMTEVIEDDPYDKVSMPDLETYNNIIQDTLRSFRCIDVDIIKDVEHIMFRFYKTKDFSNTFGQISLVEKKLAFDKNWKYVPDWKSDSIFFRGIIDMIQYFPEYLLITDYKTSRVMLNKEQLKRDMQLKIYALLLFKFLPAGSIKRAVVSIEYLRFGKIVEYEIEDIEQMAKEAEQWVNDSIKEIEAELIKDQDKAFLPKRNEFCYCCSLGDTGNCPLFNRRTINSIDNIESFEVKNEEDCKTAWKRVEANKREIKNLTTKCKTFIENSESKVIIDGNAKLDFYAEEGREYDAEKAMRLFLQKSLDIKSIVPYFSISKTNIEKILSKNKLELTEDEINQISRIKIKHNFEPCTEEEAKANAYINP